MIKYFTYCIALVISMCLLSSCSVKKTDTESSLYNEIGGQAGVERLVDAFIERIGRDKEILPYFAKSSVPHFRQGFIEHFCEVTGGPCEYQGDTMADIHTGMKITEADFNRIVELLITAMEDIKVSYPLQNKILAKLTGFRSEIINI